MFGLPHAVPGVAETPLLQLAIQERVRRELTNLKADQPRKARHDPAKLDLERLKGLLAKATEPYPKPMPVQDSRVGEMHAAQQHDAARAAWKDRVRTAMAEIVDDLPPLIASLERAQKEADDHAEAAASWRAKWGDTEKALERTREALKPFARALDEWSDEPEQERRDIWEHPLSMLVGLNDFRAARQALAEGE